MLRAKGEFLDPAVGREQGAQTRFGDCVRDVEEGEGAGGDGGGEIGIVGFGSGVGGMGLRIWVGGSGGSGDVLSVWSGRGGSGGAGGGVNGVAFCGVGGGEGDVQEAGLEFRVVQVEGGCGSVL